MRTVDITVAVPELLIAIVIVSALGTSAFWLIVAVVIVSAPYVSRIVRSAALAAISQEYVDAAKIAGERTRTSFFARSCRTFSPWSSWRRRCDLASWCCLSAASLGF